MDLFQITATFAQQHTHTLHITIDGETIHTTDEHPFLNADGAWMNAKDLQVGDEIVSADGDVGIVEAIERIDAPQMMYNLSVAIVATYLVGDGRWVVHNDSFAIELFGGLESKVNPDIYGGNVYNVDIAKDIISGIRGDALFLPFADNSINSVFITNPWVRPIRERGSSSVDLFMRSTYREVARVLISGGEMVISGNKSSNPFIRVTRGGTMQYLRQLGFSIQLASNRSPYQPLHNVFAGQRFWRTDEVDPNKRIIEEIPAETMKSIICKYR